MRGEGLRDGDGVRDSEGMKEGTERGGGGERLGGSRRKRFKRKKNTRAGLACCEKGVLKWSLKLVLHVLLVQKLNYRR